MIKITDYVERILLGLNIDLLPWVILFISSVLAYLIIIIIIIIIIYIIVLLSLLLLLLLMIGGELLQIYRRLI